VTSGNRGAQVSIGQRDQAGSMRNVSVRQGVQSAFLQHAEKFALPLRRKSRDFVRGRCAFAAKFEAAEFAIDRAGECAAFVAESSLSISWEAARCNRF